MSNSYFYERGEVRTTPSARAEGAQVDSLFHGDGARGVFQALPPMSEITRRGTGFTVGTATLFAPLVAFPSTTAALEVHNNSTGKLMVVHSLYASQILATAAQQANAIYAMVTTSKAIPTLTALNLFSLSGKAVVVPTAASDIVTGVGTTVVANGWRPYGVGGNWGLGTATPGPSWSVELDGLLVVPPSASLCMHVVGALATASSFQCGATCFMVEMPQE